MEKAVVAAPGAELSLQLLHLHGRGHGVVRYGRGEPAVGDAEEAERSACRWAPSLASVPSSDPRLRSRRPQTRPWGPMAPWCRSSAMRPMAMHPALPTLAGALVSCPSTWKVPCQVASASPGGTTSVAAGVAWVVSVVLVQPVASRHPTITTVAAMQRGIGSPAH